MALSFAQFPFFAACQGRCSCAWKVFTALGFPLRIYSSRWKILSLSDFFLKLNRGNLKKTTNHNQSSNIFLLNLMSARFNCRLSLVSHAETTSCWCTRNTGELTINVWRKKTCFDFCHVFCLFFRFFPSLVYSHWILSILETWGF